MAESKTIHELELKEAVKQGRVNRIKELLTTNNLKLNDKRYFDYYLLKEALENHLIDIVELMANNNFRVYKKSKSNQEKTVLHAAVESSDDVEFIKTLLLKGASQDILIANKENKTPFHLAIDRNQLSTIKLFMSHFDAETLDAKNLLHYAVEQDKITSVTEFIKKGLFLKKKNEENFTPFCLALMSKNSKILNRLLSYCIAKNIKRHNYDDVAPVYIASICGYLELIKKYADFGLSIDRPLNSSKESWPCLTDFSGFTLLHLAVQHNQLEVVKFLLKAGANIAVKNNDGSSPLHLAFEIKEKGIWETWQDFDDNNSIIDLILKANMKIKSNPVNKQKLSHFHIACSRDDPTVVEHLLKLGAVVNQPTKSQCPRYKGFYPLHFAAKFRCIRTLELLLKNGANVNKRDFKKMTALHIAAQESCLDTVRLLLDYGADITSMDSEGNSPVHLAFKNKNYAVIDLLLSVHIEIHSNPINAEGLSHFHIACSRNNVHVVKSFIKNGVMIDNCVPAVVPVRRYNYEDSHITDWTGYSPLHFAVCHNRAKIVQLLLDSGTSVEIKDSQGLTPLHLACHYTYEMFGEFIKTTLNKFYKHGKVALQLKPITDVTEVFENYFNGFSKCTRKISWLINRRDHLKIINSLLNYGSDVNNIAHVFNYSSTPVFNAYAAVTDIKDILESNIGDCSEGLLNQIVESLSEELYERRKLILNNLLKLDVNLDKCYSSGSILHYICSKKNADERDDEMMRLFLKNDSNIESTSEYFPYKLLTPLHVAIQNLNGNLIKTLLDYGADVNSIFISPYYNKRTPLLYICNNCSQMPLFDIANIMKILLENGANVHARQLDGKTAIHGLATSNWPWIGDTLISILIENGADINSQDNWDRTALHYACATENADVAESLLRYGADINVKDFQQNSICRFLYEYYLSSMSISRRSNLTSDMKQLIKLLQNHVMKMKVIGLPISKKELASCAKFYDFVPRTDEEQKELIDKYEGEVQILRDTKINDYYSLYNVIFQRENALAKLVKNRKFKSIVESKLFEQTYPNYGYLVRLTYQEGTDRAKLLPTAKSALYNLVGIPLPDAISEMIFSYFANSQLKESIQTMSSILNSNEKSSTMQLRSRSTRKRQKIH